jgi:hypothetical protein
MYLCTKCIRARNKLQLFKNSLQCSICILRDELVATSGFYVVGICCLSRLCIGFLLEVKCRSLRRMGRDKTLLRNVCVETCWEAAICKNEKSSG